MGIIRKISIFLGLVIEFLIGLLMVFAYFELIDLHNINLLAVGIILISLVVFILFLSFLLYKKEKFLKIRYQENQFFIKKKALVDFIKEKLKEIEKVKKVKVDLKRRILNLKVEVMGDIVIDQLSAQLKEAAKKCLIENLKLEKIKDIRIKIEKIKL